MDFTTLVNETLSIVKRPDLRTRAESFVKAAAIKAHAHDFFFKDLVEAGVKFDAARHIQNFVPREQWPRFRHIKYVRIWNYDPSSANFGGPGDFLEWIQIENSIDAYGYNKTNVAYMAGQNLQIRTRVALEYVLCGVYLFPDIADTDNLEATSFVAREFPFAIINEACARLFKSIGDESGSEQMTMLRNEEYELLKVGNTSEQGE
jgi:hypothetical protein